MNKSFLNVVILGIENATAVGNRYETLVGSNAGTDRFQRY
jgi:hypothetical protein